MTPTLSIVVPCYNEADSLPGLFSGFSTALEGRSDIEVIFVNNGSKDRSAHVFREYFESGRLPFARLVDVSVNQGYGYGILAGVRSASGSFVGWTHADSQYDPAIVVQGLKVLLSERDPSSVFVQGLRGGRGWFDCFFTFGMSVAALVMLGSWHRDINAQPKLFPRSMLTMLEHAPHDFSLDLYALMMAKKSGLVQRTFPVIFAARVHGEAKGGGSVRLKWKLTKRTFSFMWDMMKKRFSEADNE